MKSCLIKTAFFCLNPCFVRSFLVRVYNYILLNCMNELLKLCRSVFLLLLAGSCYSQNNQKTINTLAPYVLAVSETTTDTTQLPFSDIQVFDLRYDSTKIGFIKDKKIFKRLTTSVALDTLIRSNLVNRYSKYFDLTSNHTLTIFIRHFWLQETTETENQKIVVNTTPVLGLTLLTAVIETYIKMGDDFRPLARIDSSFSRQILLKKSGEMVMIPFDHLIGNVIRSNFERTIKSSRVFHKQYLDSFYAKRFEAPRFKNDLVEKGIYLTFKDFLNNQITKKDFSVEFGNLPDQLFINENGSQTLLENFWGFSEGEKNYMKVGLSFYELIKHDKSYTIWGAKFTIHNYKKYDHARSGGGLVDVFIGVASDKNRIFNSINPLQLNMDTGNLY